MNKPTKKTETGFIMAKLFTDSFPAFDVGKDISDATSEAPEWPQVDSYKCFFWGFLLLIY